MPIQVTNNIHFSYKKGIKMESISHLIDFGEKVRKIRKKMHMNQIEFYKFLFPESNSSEEAIKKKMHNIENGIQKSVDLDIFLRICDKCDVSADYLLGKENDYSNYERKAIGNYTGLSDKAIKKLHEWNIAKNKNLNLNNYCFDEAALVEAGLHDDSELTKINKDSAMLFLGMFNLLFEGGKHTTTVNDRKYEEPFSNLSIIHSIYMLCMDQPKVISGHLTKEYMEETFGYSQIFDDYVQIDASRVSFEDEANVLFPLNVETVIHQYAWKRLETAVDLLRMQIKEKKNSHMGEDMSCPFDTFQD